MAIMAACSTVSFTNLYYYILVMQLLNIWYAKLSIIYNDVSVVELPVFIA